MASAPSRYEVEQLHRLMMQASLECAQLDKRLQEERKSDGLSGELKHWHDAADTLHGAVTRAQAELLADGTPNDRVDRISERLLEIKARAKNFEIENDLEDCVGYWKALGLEFAQIAGKRRDALVGLLESRKGRIDQTTAFLSQAKESEGLAPEKHRKVLQLTSERDRAREKYEGLRQKYIEAERDCQMAERQKAKEEAAAQEHKTGSAPVPNLAALAKKGPVLVRLPVEEKKPAAASTDAKNPRAESVKPQVVKRVALPKQLEKNPPEKKTEAKKLEEKKPQGQLSAARPAATLLPRKSLSEAQQSALHEPAAARAGPPQVAVERVEKVAGYTTAMDGIGRGTQTAQIYFRANHLDESLQVQGTAAVQLGCAVRLDVIPSVQIFSAAAGAPLRGKLSLGLVSSGGRLGTVQPRNALDSAKQAASQAAGAIAGKLGFLGKQLQPAIQDVLEDAAAKIFGRAQARGAPNQLPMRQAGPPLKGPSVEFQVARFNHALGSIIVEARAVKGGQTQKHKLGALLDRDHQHRDSVAGRLEKTLQHLATATHRTLTDAGAGELRTNLARMDSLLARLKGKAGQEVAEGAQEISGLLQRMGSIASSKGGAPHLAEFKRLIDERKGELKKIFGVADKPKAPRNQLPSAQHAQASVVRQLNELRKHNPGLDKLLKNASQSQLAAELARIQKSGLHKLLPKGKPGAIGSFSLTGSFQPLGGAHLGGFGGGHRGALAGLAGGGGALGNALEKQLEAEIRRARPGDIGKILASFQKAPQGTALHELAKKAEEKQKRIAAHRGPVPANITAQALLEVFKEHPKGKNFAQHLAPGGPLRHLCEAAQRGHGLPIGKMAQHYLASRGASQVWNAVQTFNSLVKEGHQPRFRGLGDLLGGLASTATRSIGNVTQTATSFASQAASTVRSGISSVTSTAGAMGRTAMQTVSAVTQRAVGSGRGMINTAASFARSELAQGRSFVRGEAGLARQFAGGPWNLPAAQRLVRGWIGQGQSFARSQVGQGRSFLRAESGQFGSLVRAESGLVQSGIRRETGLFHSMAGAIGSTAHRLADAGRGAAGGLASTGAGLLGGLRGVGGSLAHIAAGQLGGAASWAQRRIGSVAGAARGIAAGAPQGGAGGAVDSFDPGMFGALKKMKGFTTAEKLLGGKKLSKAEAAFLKENKFAGPLRGLEKAMQNPKLRRSLGGLEKLGGKAVKGGIWLSGKAAKAQSVLDTVVNAGDTIHGVLSEVHDVAPGLSNLLGDNAAGHFVGQCGDWAGKGDDKLAKALEYGHAASDKLSQYKGYLDKGLGCVGVKHPQKAYEKMMARKDLKAGKKGSLAQVGRQKLEDRQAKHPELHLAEATGKRTRGKHAEAPSARNRKTASDQPATRLEQALAKGKHLIKKGQRVAQGVHGGLGKVHSVVANGLQGAEQVQGDLEKASQLARMGAGILGEDSELGKYLLDVSARADKVHSYLAQSISLADEFNHRISQVHDGMENIPGVHADEKHPGQQKKAGSPLDAATHLEGKAKGQPQSHEAKRSPHDALSEASHPDIFANTKNIYSVRTKVESFGEALHDTDAHEQLKKVLEEAKAAKADLQRLKAKYKSDKVATGFLGSGEQDRLIDEPIKKLEAALKGEAPGGKKPLQKRDPSKAKPAARKKPEELVKTAHHGLKAIDKYKKKALKAGKKVDAGLTRVERELSHGVKVGKKVDAKLAGIAGLADRVAKALGDDSPIGHLAEQLGQAAHGGHDELHEALHMVSKGKSTLHKGHELFHQAMAAAVDHHGKKLEKVHGKKPAGAEHEHGGAPHAELLRHAVAPDKHKSSPHGEQLPAELSHLAKDGKRLVHGVEHGYADVRHLWKDGKHAWGDAKGVWGDVASGNWKAALKDSKGLVGDVKGLFGEGKGLVGDVKGLIGGAKGLIGEAKGIFGGLMGLFGGGQKPSPHDVSPGGQPQRTPSHGAAGKPAAPPQPHAPQKDLGEAGVAQLVQSALQSVTSFGNEVASAVKEVGALMQAGNTKEAGDKVQALSMLSEHTRSEVTRAVSSSAKFAKLSAQAQAASKHYLEIRGHFFQFVKGLHGLAGQAQEVDAKGFPDLAQLMADIKSLSVKVGALGDAKSSDSGLSKAAADLQTEAKALRARLDKAAAKHAKEEKAQPVVQDLESKLAQVEQQLGGHADKAAAKKGDKALAVNAKGGKKPGAPEVGTKPAKPKDQVDDLVGGILGDDHRIHIDRGGARGDMDVHEGQDIDTAASDTWIGSGEGIKLFSEVFGAFIPAEGAVVVTHHAGGGGKRHGGGEHAGPGGGAPSHLPGPGLPLPRAGGGAVPALPGGIQVPGGEDIPGLPGGFPGGLPDLPGMGGQEGGVGGILGRVGQLLPGSATGFFKGLFDRLSGFADKIAGWSKFGAGILGKGMHFAEMGMHGLKMIEGAAGKVQGFAGKAEGFLDKMGLHKLAGFAGKIGGAAGWVDKEAGLLHGGLKTADKWMGKGKSVAGQIEGGSKKAGGIFDEAAQGKFGALVNLFKASKSGDGTDGKLVPEKMSLNSMLDEPRRLDVTTLSRMERFLGGSFAGVRIHTGPGAAQVTSRFAAEAVTVKDHIFFAPGRFNPSTAEGQKLLAHELTHVLQKGRPNLDVRTAESEALHSERSYRSSPDMTTLDLSQPQADFKLGDGMGLGNASGVHTAKRNRSRGHEVGGKDTLPDGEEFIEQVSGRVYDLLMEELEHNFESR